MAAETITTTKSDISLHERAVIERLIKSHDRTNWRNSQISRTTKHKGITIKYYIKFIIIILKKMKWYYLGSKLSFTLKAIDTWRLYFEHTKTVLTWKYLLK